MSPRKVRALFVAAGLGLILQYALVGLIGITGAEPWPAVVLPGFKTVYDDGDTVLLERPVIYVVFANKERVAVEPSRLLSPLPRSHHPSFLQAQCRPATLSGTRISQQCQTPEGRQWIFNQAMAAFPDRPIRGITVRWERFRLNPQTGASSSVPLDSLHLSEPSTLTSNAPFKHVETPSDHQQSPEKSVP